ncbi:MAG: hypothetical protein EU544_01900 [Promethearchaeota archaeon]|nr:MAG: hypothetical protein EU544_01900 [Candidatus Lokiarchaeota archaeon]
MKLYNIWTMTKKNLNQMKRDPRMIALSIFAPIIVTALFGSIFGGELNKIEVILINNDEGFDELLSDNMMSTMALDPRLYFNITSDPVEARLAVDNNYSQAAIIFPESFTDRLLTGKPTEVELYISYNNTTTANYIISVFQSSSTQAMEEMFGESLFSISIVSVYDNTVSPGNLPGQINISLCNPDKGWTKSLLSDDIYDLLEENETLSITTGNDIEEARQKVKIGEARAVIIFPNDFTYKALVSKKLNIEVILDGAEPQACLAITGIINYGLAEAFSEKFDQSMFEIEDYYYNNPDGTDEPVEMITYFTPAILCFIVFFFSFLLTMLSFLRERTQGTMERILTSPLDRGDIILGYVFSFSILAIIQATSVILTTILIFNSQVEYTLFSLLQAYLIIYIVVLGALGLGIFLSTLAKTEFQILQFIPLIIIPFMLLSGVWSPIETLPDWLRPISSLIPLTYSNLAMRDILLRGETIIDVIIPFTIISVFAVVMILLGTLKLSKKLQ